MILGPGITKHDAREYPSSDPMPLEHPIHHFRNSTASSEKTVQAPVPGRVCELWGQFVQCKYLSTDTDEAHSPVPGSLLDLPCSLTSPSWSRTCPKRPPRHPGNLVAQSPHSIASDSIVYGHWQSAARWNQQPSHSCSGGILSITFGPITICAAGVGCWLFLAATTYYIVA